MTKGFGCSAYVLIEKYFVYRHGCVYILRVNLYILVSVWLVFLLMRLFLGFEVLLLAAKVQVAGISITLL